MNQKPVDDKDAENILLAFANSVLDVRNGRGNPTLGELINPAVKALNAHFQKKYIGLIEKAFSFIDFEDKNEWIPPEQIREALANIKSE